VSDDEFLTALESCTLNERDFGHAAHVRLAYLYLRSGGFARALDRMQGSIRRYATSLGKPNRYHETITVAFLALIQQALYVQGNDEGWDAFARSNPQLLQRDLLLQFYSQAQLESELARQVFLLPPRASSEAESCAG
jgi:hypothetical protein